MSVKKNTRDKIIISAKKLFAKGGFKSVSMSKIAEDTSISKASLYYFFRDKIDIYFAVVEDLVNAVGDVFYEASQTKNNNNLAKIIENAIKVSILEGSAFMRLDAGLVNIQEEQKKKMHDLFQNFFEKVENLLKFYNVNEPKLATYVLLSSIHTYVREACLRNSKISVRAYSQYLESLFIKN